MGARDGHAESTLTGVPYVDVRETHTGVVVLAGERAYKAKKPVLTDFLDFRTARQREHACLREIELNSRLSPESYLGIAYLSDPAGGPAEPVVVMRRYRDDDRLASIVSRSPDGSGESGESVRDVLDAIAGVLARFHERAERNPVISAQGEPGAIDRRWRENLSELNGYAEMTTLGISAESLARIQRLAAEFVAGRGALFERRIEEGCIVDGHADLLADDVFWVNGEAVLLDCLEFDDQLRYVDRIDDCAFLAMDLEFLGRKDLGDYFLERHAAHAADTAPPSLRHFYVAYRAVVRAKVDCVRASQAHPDAGMGAVRHLDIALRHLADGAVRLAIVGGNPGTGKSTLSHALAERVGAQVISTDDVRRQLRHSGAITGSPGVLDAELYAPEHVATVYEAALSRARVFLRNGQSVILDGTWRDPVNRASARRLAVETHSALVELMCAVPIDTAIERIHTRRPGKSDATPRIAAALAAREHSWDTARRVDTSRGLGHSLRSAHDAWHRAIDSPGRPLGATDTNTAGLVC